jgi:hypothetical protein
MVRLFQRLRNKLHQTRRARAEAERAVVLAVYQDAKRRGDTRAQSAAYVELVNATHAALKAAG